MNPYQQLVEKLNALQEPLENADYRQLVNHVNLADLNQNFGEELLSVLLCLHFKAVRPNKALMKRLQRYQQEGRLTDLAQAIDQLSKTRDITEELVDRLLDRTPKRQSFLPAVALIEAACLAGFLSNGGQVVNSDAFRDLEVKKANFYLRLAQESLLTLNVIKNLRYSRLPTESGQIDSAIAIYRYAIHYKVDADLNSSSIDVISLYRKQEILSALQSIEAAKILTGSLFIAVCKAQYSSQKLAELILLLQSCGLDQATIVDTVARCEPSSFSSLYSILSVVKQFVIVPVNSALFAITPVNSTLLDRLLSSQGELDELSESLKSLKKRALLKPAFFEVLLDYCDTQREAKARKAAGRKRTYYGDSKETKTDFEPADLLFCLHQSGLLDSDSDIGWVKAYFNETAIEFLLDLFHLGALNAHSFALAKEVDFNSGILRQLRKLARYHVPMPDQLPKEQVEDYLDLLKRFVKMKLSLTPELQQKLLKKPVKARNTLKVLATNGLLSVDHVEALFALEGDPLSSADAKAYLICQKVGLPSSHFNALKKYPNLRGLETAFNRIKAAGLSLLSDGWAGRPAILTILKTSENPEEDAALIVALSAVEMFTTEVWQQLAPLSAAKKRQLPVLMKRLHGHGLCNGEHLRYLLPSKNMAIALQAVILLSQANLLNAAYWNNVITHANPLLMCQGLLLLGQQGQLTRDHSDKISQSAQPQLAAQALSDLLRAKIPLSTCWEDVLKAENPVGYAEVVIGSATPGIANDAIPAEVQTIIGQHKQPEIARGCFYSLNALKVPLKTTIAILPQDNVEKVVKQLLRINQATALDAMLIDAIQKEPQIGDPVYRYVTSSLQSPEGLTRVCQSRSPAEASALLEILLLGYQHNLSLAIIEPFIDSDLEQDEIVETGQIFSVLAEVGELNSENLERVQGCRPRLKIAQLIRALKQGGIYTDHYFNRILSSGIEQLDTVCELAKEKLLTPLSFEFVMQTTDKSKIDTMKRLLPVPGIHAGHLDWLSRQSGSNGWYASPLSGIFKKLDSAGLLNLEFVEKIMNYNKDGTLEDIENQLRYIPSDLLDADNVTRMLNTSTVCYINDADNYYNPFEKFSDNDSDLLTKEVITIILEQPSGESYKVYHMMKSLKDAGLFEPEMIACCRTQEITKAIVALSENSLLNAKNRSMVLSSAYPDVLSELIINLVAQQKFSETTAELLALGTKSVVCGSSSYYGRWDSMTYILNDIVQRYSCEESTIQFLLTAQIDWEYLKKTLEVLDKKALTDTGFMLLASVDQRYLRTYLYNEYYSREGKHCTMEELMRLCRYEPLLNQPELIKEMSKLEDWSYQKTVDKDELKQKLNRLWKHCEENAVEAIRELLLPEGMDVTISLSPR